LSIPTGGLDMLEKIKISCPSREENPESSAIQPVTWLISMYLSIYLSIYLQPFVGPWPPYSFKQTVGLLGRGISPSQGRYLQIRENKENNRTHTYIHASCGIRTHDRSVRASEESSCLRGPIHVQVWLASPTRLGFQWAKLVRVWVATFIRV
jgi:hypothetical protein